MPWPGDRVIFIDRDGVINRRRPGHVLSWSDLEFLPRSLLALRRLHELSERCVVVTNQSVVGLGLITDAELNSIHARLVDVVSANGGLIERIYACPHSPTYGCDCRKPRAGLLLGAASDLGVELERSIMIGDGLTDVRAAQAAGCQAILVGDRISVGLGPEVPAVSDLWEAVSLIAAQRGPVASATGPTRAMD